VPSGAANCLADCVLRARVLEFVRTESSLVFFMLFTPRTPPFDLVASLCRVATFLELTRRSKYGISSLQNDSNSINISVLSQTVSYRAKDVGVSPHRRLPTLGERVVASCCVFAWHSS
jgi:hypothetical protein